jgi:hypothetical protein
MTGIQSQIILELLSSGEYRTRRDRNANFQRASMDIERIDLRCAFDPQKIAAARRGNSITGGEMSLQ